MSSNRRHENGDIHRINYFNDVLITFKSIKWRLTTSKRWSSGDVKSIINETLWTKFLAYVNKM